MQKWFHAEAQRTQCGKANQVAQFPSIRRSAHGHRRCVRHSKRGKARLRQKVQAPCSLVKSGVGTHGVRTSAEAVEDGQGSHFSSVNRWDRRVSGLRSTRADFILLFNLGVLCASACKNGFTQRRRGRRAERQTKLHSSRLFVLRVVQTPIKPTLNIITRINANMLLAALFG